MFAKMWVPRRLAKVVGHEHRVTFSALGIVSFSLARRFLMRIIVLVAAATLAVACEAAYAQDQPTIELAQATTTAPADPAAAPAAAPTTAQPAPAAQAAPDAAPTAKAKPAKKRVAKRRSWQSDEAKARSIAAKYGVTW
jgi:hypothetical protein